MDLNLGCPKTFGNIVYNVTACGLTKAGYGASITKFVDHCFVLMVSETCRCLRSCSASHVPSSCLPSSPIMTTCIRIIIKNHSSSSSKCLQRKSSSRLSSPPSAGVCLYFVEIPKCFTSECRCHVVKSASTLSL